MRLKTKKNPKPEWRKRFAFYPVCVKKNEDGSKEYVWLEYLEYKVDVPTSITLFVPDWLGSSHWNRRIGSAHSYFVSMGADGPW